MTSYVRFGTWLALSSLLGACGSDDAASSATSGQTSTAGVGGASSSSAQSSSSAASSGSGGGEVNGWQLVWSDEFDGDTIDASKWEHEVNCWGGGNNEQECYVGDAKNSFVKDGALHIVALHDNPTGAVGGPGNDPTIVTRPYSSARLITKNHGDYKYGRFEARLTLPYGQGLWPAFWLLPTDNKYGGWAASGEIDIMEAVNLGPGNNKVYGTLHYGGQWPNNVHTGADVTPPDNVWEVAHVYAVEWEEGEVRWFVDDKHYETQTKWNSAAAPFPAPFDERFFVILNVAVGGAWPGDANDQTKFPQEMVVDYVRIYQCTKDPVAGHGCGTSDPNVKPL